ncbi:MAG: hypothetical protein V1810_02310 [Candidatus Beckwithbacteria bacterium]
MKEPQVILIRGATVLERLQSIIESLGISTWLGSREDFITTAVLAKSCHNKPLAPKTAFIHLSAEIIENRPRENKDIEGMILSLLPETSRRVFLTYGHQPKDVARIAILLGGDMIFEETVLTDHPEWIQKILERQEATEEEIRERGKTIEIDGKRMGLDLRRDPEVNMYPAGVDPRDNYYKRGKEE